MQVIALAGRSAQTETRLRSLLQASGLQDEGLVRYRHWTGRTEASVAAEAARLAGARPDVLVAKSFGTNVAALAYEKHGLRPASVIPIGTPYEAVSVEEQNLLRKLAHSTAVRFIQQARDPGGPAARLAATLGVSAGPVTEVPGDDHLYGEIALVSAIVREWLASYGRRGDPAA